MNNKELFEKSLKYVPGGVHSPVRSFKGLHTTPRFVNRGKGAFIWDEEGKDYIDFCMSFGPLIHGHQDPEIKEAIIKALDNGWTFGACEKYSLELAEYIVNKISFIEQIRFVNSGTEAVMTAIRLARGVTGRSKIIKFNGCYHGHTDSMLIKAGSGLAGEAEASSKGVTKHQAEDTLICELGDLNEVKEVFERFPTNIAAIFIEPLPANNGLLVQSQEFLQGLRDLCTKYGAMLVFDEVISGFRIGFGGMSEKTGIHPDIVTYGKIIGGGMPVGAIAGKKQVMEFLAPIGPVYQAGTLSGNPVAMAAGLVNLKKLTPEAYVKLENNTKNVVALMKDWMDKNGFEDYQTIQYGSLFYPISNHNKLTKIGDLPANMNERFKKLFEIMLNKGIYLAPNAYEVGFGSLAHDEKVQEEMKRRLWT
ncbi:glutamate-1-semialdehyde 2,1-aminomutase [Peredibacter starrii]|uniref:Glutamate-1-semialdehyde 2,1-aminomutase n=1 Tax=Peredibacter starrii TaxID=28202 RepID=A0AAX4HL91_9BACT|nr:glutamate-1-semialdehyde 2,1-aminomutase [Peredibacter starrii]WPU64033.1 glutamate-1-semialdehyde 2,1-aminomutase [Peredibacter starrii]